MCHHGLNILQKVKSSSTYDISVNTLCGNAAQLYCIYYSSVVQLQCCDSLSNAVRLYLRFVLFCIKVIACAVYLPRD